MTSSAISRRHLSRLICVLVSSLATAVVLADVPQSEPPAPITWRGCGITKKAFMGVCAKAYEKETGQKIIISGGGAALGIRAAAGGSADLGGTCRHHMPGRFDSERGVKTAIIAWDALVAVTHPSNPVSNLSKQQLVDILHGQITNWREVGGENQPIIVGGRKGNESGVGVMMRALILEDANFEFPRKSILLRSSGPLEKFLEKTPGSVAITGISSAKKRNLKVISIDHINPSLSNISSGKYPYYRPLYMAYKQDAATRIHRFIDWIQSAKGQAVVASQGTVTLELGLPLMTKYKHWDDTSDITNFEPLLIQAQASNSQ